MSRPTKEESIYKVSIHKNGGYMESVRTDLYLGFLEGAEVLQKSDMSFECVVFFCGNRELIKV